MSMDGKAKFKDPRVKSKDRRANTKYRSAKSKHRRIAIHLDKSCRSGGSFGAWCCHSLPTAPSSEPSWLEFASFRPAVMKTENAVGVECCLGAFVGEGMPQHKYIQLFNFGT